MTTDEPQTLEIHLSTNNATGELVVDFVSTDDSINPVNVGKWPGVREDLRERVHDEIINPRNWEITLDSDRPGERFDVHVGDVILTGDVVEDIRIWLHDVDDIDWSQHT